MSMKFLKFTSLPNSFSNSLSKIFRSLDLGVKAVISAQTNF